MQEGDGVVMDLPRFKQEGMRRCPCEREGIILWHTFRVKAEVKGLYSQ